MTLRFSGDSRRVKRVRVLMPCTWYLERLDWSGTGELIDVSHHGARLRLDAVSVPSRDEAIVLAAPHLPTLPPEAILRWQRRLHTRVESYLCGVHFVEPTPAWASWVAAAAVSVKALRERTRS